MGFFDALKRVLRHEVHADRDEAARDKIRRAWGLEDEPEAVVPESPDGSGAYDRKQWQKKLRTLIDDLPESRGRWQELMTEAHALDFEASWIEERQREEFAFLIRRSVADRVISEQEHDRIELARKLIGIQDAEAEKTLKSIMTEAESFFGKPVRDEGAKG